MKPVTLLMLFSLLIINVYSQPAATIYNPAIPYTENYGDWGTDYIISNTEPMGAPSGIYRNSNNTIYVSVPDTNIQSGRGIVVLKSTNNGVNWAIHASVTPAFICPKTKMVGRPGSDSVYCFFMFGASVYCWNIVNNNLNLFSNHTDLRDFDATMSSTGSLYLIVDYRATNQVYWMGSTNGGTNWAGQIYMSSTAVRPRITMSATGDTALIIYYGVSILNDTNTSGIRFVRYREISPGTLTSMVGSFTTILPAGTSRDQVQAVRHGTNSWIFYAADTLGSKDLVSLVSTDGGTVYTTRTVIGSLPGRDEYWFDAEYYNLGAGGVDVIYYSDTAQSGPPTALTDRLYHTFALNTTPSTFSSFTILSQSPPAYSARGYIPCVFEYYDTGGDIGALWVGVNSGNKLFFDRYNAVVGINNNGTEIPNHYSLSQNYPNPFNPSTKIDFAIPVSGNVTVTVYDIIGRETATLLNKEMKAGSYTVDFNASKLSSGVYFYKIISGSYIETKKMILVK